MFTNYLKVTLRNLLKNKGFSLISIIGLAASMSVCLLVIVFLKMQWSYDAFHENAGRIYHIYSDYKAPINSTNHLYATSPAYLGFVLKNDVPGVEDFVSLRRYSGSVIDEAQKLNIQGFYASESFFSILDFKLVKGDANTALQEPYSMVISRITAERLFGDEEPVGATLTVAEQGEFLVTGILAETTAPTLFEFEVLASFATLQAEKNQPAQLAPWDKTVRSFFTFVLLRKDASVSDLMCKWSMVSTKTSLPIPRS